MLLIGILLVIIIVLMSIIIMMIKDVMNAIIDKPKQLSNYLDDDKDEDATEIK